MMSESRNVQTVLLVTWLILGSPAWSRGLDLMILVSPPTLHTPNPCYLTNDANDQIVLRGSLP